MFVIELVKNEENIESNHTGHPFTHSGDKQLYNVVLLYIVKMTILFLLCGYWYNTKMGKQTSLAIWPPRVSLMKFSIHHLASFKSPRMHF